MLKLLLKNAIASPAKLLALCVVMYLARHRCLLPAFLLVLAGRWLMKAMKEKAKTIEAAAVEPMPAEVATPAMRAVLLQPPRRKKPVAFTPTRRYAKSACGHSIQNGLAAIRSPFFASPARIAPRWVAPRPLPGIQSRLRAMGLPAITGAISWQLMWLPGSSISSAPRRRS